MKIVVISTCFPTKSNPNSGIFIFQQLKALTELGVECHLIQPVNWYPPLGLHKLHPYWRKGYKQFHDNFDEYYGIEIHKPKIFIKMPKRFFSQETWETFGKTIAKYLKTNKRLRDISLIYSHFLCYEGYASVFVKNELNYPLVVIARGDDVHDWPNNNPNLIKNLNRVFENADLILANSKRLAIDTQKWMQSKVRSVETIYNGVDIEKFHPVESYEKKIYLRTQFNLRIEKKYLLCIATPVILKGWRELLTAWSLLGNLNGWHLIAVAPPRNFQDSIDLNQLANEVGIENSFTLIPGINHDQLPALIKACDAFVLPSYNEGMSNALLEAMSSGLPVIATDVGGHSEVIESGRNGYLINPKSIEELQTTLLKLINIETNQLNSMGADARLTMEKLGTYKHNALLLLKKFQACEKS